MPDDARPEHSARSGRALLAFAVLMAVGGASLTAAALWPRGTGGAVLDVTSVTAPAPPETVPVTSPDARAPVEQPTVTSTTAALEVEPARISGALGLPPRSAIPIANVSRVAPRAVTIDDIELQGSVRPVGLRDDGAMEIPDATEIGWYRYGASPGRPGATVLAAHVSWNGDVGPFLELGKLEPGARIDVRLEDDSLRTYEVVERTMYDKDALPRNRIWRTTGDETLVLITCGGDFNPDIRRYRQNIVVYAVPVT